MNWQKSLAMTGSIVIPTPAGIPITLNTTLLGQAFISGGIKFQMDTSLSSLLSTVTHLSDLTVPSFSANLALQPQISFNGHVMLGAHVGPLKVQTGAQISALSAMQDDYFSIQCAYNSQNKKLDVKMSLPSKQQIVLDSSLVPSNVFTVCPSESSNQYTFDVKEVRNCITSTQSDSYNMRACFGFLFKLRTYILFILILIIIYFSSYQV